MKNKLCKNSFSLKVFHLLFYAFLTYLYKANKQNENPNATVASLI